MYEPYCQAVFSLLSTAPEPPQVAINEATAPERPHVAKN